MLSRWAKAYIQGAKPFCYHPCLVVASMFSYIGFPTWILFYLLVSPCYICGKRKGWLVDIEAKIGLKSSPRLVIISASSSSSNSSFSQIGMPFLHRPSIMLFGYFFFCCVQYFSASNYVSNQPFHLLASFTPQPIIVDMVAFRPCIIELGLKSPVQPLVFRRWSNREKIFLFVVWGCLNDTLLVFYPFWNFSFFKVKAHVNSNQLRSWCTLFFLFNHFGFKLCVIFYSVSFHLWFFRG